MTDDRTDTALTAEQLEIVEDIVDHYVEHGQPHVKKLDAEWLASFRALTIGTLRGHGLPLPSDALLNEIILDMCDFHELPVEPGQRS